MRFINLISGFNQPDEELFEPTSIDLLEGGSGKSKHLMRAPGKRFASRRCRLARPSNSIEDLTEDEASESPKMSPEQAAESEKAPKRGPNWQLDCKYTMKEVQQHNTLDDCWMVIFDKVYNITDFVYEHPGGDFILLEYAGQDATHSFLSTRHGSAAHKMLDKYWIGTLVDEELYYSNHPSYCSIYSNLSWRTLKEFVGTSLTSS